MIEPALEMSKDNVLLKKGVKSEDEAKRRTDGVQRQIDPTFHQIFLSLVYKVHPSSSGIY